MRDSLSGVTSIHMKETMTFKNTKHTQREQRELGTMLVRQTHGEHHGTLGLGTIVVERHDD